MDVTLNFLVVLGLLTLSGRHASLFNWSQEYISSFVTIRLIKKDCRPPGPPGQSDDMLDEYTGDVETAFNALFTFSCEYVTQPLSQAEMLFQDPNYDSSLDSIYIVPPKNAAPDAFFTRSTITALAMRNVHKKYNIFTADMVFLTPYMIHTIVMNALGQPTQYQNLAEAVSSFLIKGINLGVLKTSQINMVGFSYSGNLVGYMGRYIKLLFGEKIPSILSLDPYTNSYNSHLIQVSREDAEVVHVFHSNSAFAGTRERIGTADFVFNNGHLQPECVGTRVFKNTIPLPLTCSHMKVVQRFWYVILYPSKFVARKCDSWTRFVACDCESNPTAVMSYPFVKNQKPTGTHFIRTLETKPYGVGVWGSECTSEARLKLRNRKAAERLKQSVVVD